jgi:hypothetical protein
MLNLGDDFRDERPERGQALIEPNLGGGATDGLVAMAPGLLVLRGSGVGAEGVWSARGPVEEGGKEGGM